MVLTQDTQEIGSVTIENREDCANTIKTSNKA